MAERTSVKSPVSAFATRLGSALSIGIVLGAVLIAFLIGLWLTFGGDLGPLADPIPNQNQPTEESVPTEEPFPTNTPSPTATEIPPTETPTQTPTVTLTPTATQAPLPTPIMQEDFFTKGQVNIFVNELREIFIEHNFYLTFQCVSQDKPWSENVDPFVLEYLPDLQGCYYMGSPCEAGFCWDPIEDEQILEDVRSGVIELEDLQIEHDDLTYTVLYQVGSNRSDGWEYFNYIRAQGLNVPAWECCAFLERTYREYGWRHWEYYSENPYHDRTVMVERELIKDLSRPYYNIGVHCPNFDPYSVYFMFESLRLGLISEEESFELRTEYQLMYPR